MNPHHGFTFPAPQLYMRLRNRGTLTTLETLHDTAQLRPPNALAVSSIDQSPLLTRERIRWAMFVGAAQKSGLTSRTGSAEPTHIF